MAKIFDPKERPSLANWRDFADHVFHGCFYLSRVEHPDRGVDLGGRWWNEPTMFSASVSHTVVDQWGNGYDIQITDETVNQTRINPGGYLDRALTVDEFVTLAVFGYDRFSEIKTIDVSELHAYAVIAEEMSIEMIPANRDKLRVAYRLTQP